MLLLPEHFVGAKKLNISTDDPKYQEIYCGLLSNFVSVPRKPSVNLQIIVGFKGHYYVDFSFSVTDPRRLETFVGIQKKQKLREPPKMTVYFPETAISLLRFTVKVKFFLIIIFILSPEIRKFINVHDGPGTLCSKLSPFIKINTKVIYITSSFQSMIFLKSGFPNSTHAKYESLKNIVSKHMSQTESSLHKLSYPINECYNTYTVCIIEMKTKPWLYFNVTIMNIYHQYIERMLCDYGGIASYDIINARNKVISKLCYVHSGKYHYQNIYSNSSTAQLVIYSYKEYGPFNVTLHVTTTRCQAFTIDVCNLVNWNIEVSVCPIFQLKQMESQYLEQNNLYSDWMFGKALWILEPYNKIKRQYHMSVEFTGK